MIFSKSLSFWVVATIMMVLSGCAQNATSNANNASHGSTNAEVAENSELKESQTGNAQALKPKEQNKAQKAQDLPTSIAILPFNNLSEQAAATETLRYTLFGHLASSNYRFPHLKDIDNRLVILDPSKKLLPKDAGMLSSLLDVDALLYVDVLNYDKLYAGIYAQITFAVKVTLVNAKGQTIWQGEFEEVSREGGISANALTLLYSIAVTAMHLSDENLLAVADKLGRKIAVDFPQPKQYQVVTHSFIDTVLHDGRDKVFKYGDSLQVGIKGEANKTASVKIEGINQFFSLQEKEPGIYMATLAVDHSWNGHNLMLTGILRDSSGASSKYISSVGLLNFDNTPPEPVTIIRHKIDSTHAKIEWQKIENNINFTLFSVVGGQHKMLFETSGHEFVWAHHLGDFATVQLAIVAKDKAGNQSSETVFSAPVYPLASMYDATVWQQSRLPESLQGQMLLRRQDGPFIVDQKVVQQTGSSLFIEPGTEITFTNAGNLLIQGSLFTFAHDPVQLKPLSSLITGQTFLSLDSNEHVEINGLRISQAGIGIEVLKGKPAINNCEITDSQYSALVVANSAAVSIDHCLLNGSNTSALVITDQARVHINNSRFINNFPFHIQSSSIYEIDASGNLWDPEASPMTVLGNVRF